MFLKSFEQLKNKARLILTRKKLKVLLRHGPQSTSSHWSAPKCQTSMCRWAGEAQPSSSPWAACSVPLKSQSNSFIFLSKFETSLLSASTNAFTLSRLPNNFSFKLSSRWSPLRSFSMNSRGFEVNSRLAEAKNVEDFLWWGLFCWRNEIIMWKLRKFRKKSGKLQDN